MPFEMLIALVCGIVFGIITGLTPGIHINLVSALIVASSAVLLRVVEPFTLAVCIISMGVTHTFLDTIPSIYLGAPSEATALSVLPGHRLLLEGRGFEAVRLTIVGSLVALLITIILIPLLIPVLGIVQAVLSRIMAVVLLWVLFVMVLTERGLSRRLWSIGIILVCGVLGVLVLDMPGLDEPLFPLLSGLFGTSQLLCALFERVAIPEQKEYKEVFISRREEWRALFSSAFSGSLVGLLPGVGSSTAAMISTYIIGGFSSYSFLMLVGGIGTANFVFSLAAFYSIEKARNGAIVAVMALVHSISARELAVLCACALIAGGIGTILALRLARAFSRMMRRINYAKTCMVVMSFIAVLAVMLGGWLGLLVLAVSTAVGLLPALVRVKRSSAMACILVPVTLFFLGLR